MNKKMERLRKAINGMIISERSNSAELLRLSQEMDKMIILFIKKNDYVKRVLGDGLMKDFDIFLDKLQLFEKMYHSMRIVDPVKKKVLEIKDNEFCETDFVCHHFWQKNMVCDNCISMRAYNENDTIFKIEYNDNNIYMVTAVPVTIQNIKLVVEFLKNSTDHVFVGSAQCGNGVKVLSSIEFMNQAIVRDDLTQLFNRRFINERLPADLLNASMHSEPLSIIFADLDYFKLINDTYGHAAGDQILRQVAEEFLHYTRSGKDWVSRYGGEEFMICLTDSDAEVAQAVAERIRKNIEEKEFDYGPHKIKLTCSFGVYTTCDECLSMDSIIDLVDKKLYLAKSKGRNTVV